MEILPGEREGWAAAPAWVTHFLCSSPLLISIVLCRQGEFDEVLLENLFAWEAQTCEVREGEMCRLRACGKGRRVLWP